jgi:hypothetical protein
VVGYRVPPTHSQFKRGQSGNPKGRPKKAFPRSTGPTSVDEITLRHAERQIDVREGSEVRKVSVLEAVSLAQVKTAIGGSPHAQRDVLLRYQLADQERCRKIAEDCEYWERYVDRTRMQIASAVALGKPPPKILPHPDDIEIDYVKGVQFHGPLCEESEAHILSVVQYLEVLMMQDALDRIKIKASCIKDANDGPGGAMVYMWFINRFVPRRYQITELHAINRHFEYRRLPIRVIEKQLYRAWKSLGSSMHRGETYSTLGRATSTLKFLVHELQQAKQCR